MGIPKANLPRVERRSFALQEIAARNGVSVSYVYQEVSRGHLPVVRAGPNGAMRVTPEGETAWLNSAREQTA